MITVAAPIALAYIAESTPIGPAPVTRTISPPVTPAQSTPYAATHAGSMTAPSRSDTVSGRTAHWVSSTTAKFARAPVSALRPVQAIWKQSWPFPRLQW